jgi:hypothetical protein
MWYAFKNKSNGRYIHGTDFRCTPHRQRLSTDTRPPMLFNSVNLLTEIKHRNINLKTYEVVCVYGLKEHEIE